MPRPKVEWNLGSAVLAYDAQIATSGITTVFDSLRIGIGDNELRAGMGAKTETLADEIERCARGRHAAGRPPDPHPLRSAGDRRRGGAGELSRQPQGAPALTDGPHARTAAVPRPREVLHLLQRQDREIGSRGLADVARRQATGADAAAANRPKVVDIARRHAIPLASHDDTTVDEVRLSISEGVTIAEFPDHDRIRRRLEGGRAAHGDGRAECRARGGSHSAMSRRARSPRRVCSTSSPRTTCRRASCWAPCRSSMRRTSAAAGRDPAGVEEPGRGDRPHRSRRDLGRQAGGPDPSLAAQRQRRGARSLPRGAARRMMAAASSSRSSVRAARARTASSTGA